MYILTILPRTGRKNTVKHSCSHIGVLMYKIVECVLNSKFSRFEVEFVEDSLVSDVQSAQERLFDE